MQAFIDSYCKCDTTLDERPAHVIDVHARDILLNTLQPVFKRQTQMHPVLSKRPEPKYRAAHETDLHENQQWKQDNNVELLFWVIEQISAKDLEENLHLVIPPVLIVLDDYDILYKEYGVKMVHIIIKKLNLDYILKYGLDDVFFESLFKCLSYLSQDRDVTLLKASYPCVMDLISSIKGEQKRSNLYERVLTDGIITGYMHAGQKIKFLPILLGPISKLHDELGSVSVQYLKAIIPILCDSMAMPSNNNKDIREINELAVDSLSTVIKQCWPRIPSYRGPIMKSIAKSWSYYFGTHDQDMCDKLKELCKVFGTACQGQEKADKEALISYNPGVYEPLFSR